MDRFVYYKIELITQIKTCTVASEGNDVRGGEAWGWGRGGGVSEQEEGEAKVAPSSLLI